MSSSSASFNYFISSSYSFILFSRVFKLSSTISFCLRISWIASAYFSSFSRSTMTKSSVFFSFVRSYSNSPNLAGSSLTSETILVLFFDFLPFLDLVLVVKTVVDKFFLSSSYYNLEASIASKACFCSSINS